MKNQLLSAAFILIAHTLLSQDIIVKKDSSKDQANILEIKPGEVKYKLHGYADGPTIIISKRELAYVRFQNGSTQFFSEKEIAPVQEYNPDKYNLDQNTQSYVPSRPSSNYAKEMTAIKKEKAKHYEKLYDRESYLGFNYLAFLNGNFGFNYMRDLRKSNLIINVPFAFGFAKPHVTNAFYNMDHETGGNGTTRYKKMDYMGGLAVLFTPSMKYNVNFLIGPAVSFTQFDVSTKKTYYSYSYLGTPAFTFSNDFKVYRLQYGIDVGLQARFTEKLNMSFLMTYGYKQDSFSEEDAFGLEEAAKHGVQVNVPENDLPYVTMALSLGYRF
jgi:hypothetical protein